MIQDVYIVHGTPFLSESCLTVRYHYLFFNLSSFVRSKLTQTNYTRCLSELFRGSFLLYFSRPFCKYSIRHFNQSLYYSFCPIHLCFILHSAPSRCPSLFQFPDLFPTSSTVIFVPSGAVCFFFISISILPFSFFPSRSCMKYSSHSRIVISSLNDTFFFLYLSFCLCIPIPPSLFLFPLSLSPPSPSLCIFFSVLDGYGTCWLFLTHLMTLQATKI
jgi:hypothetical protein